MYSDFGDYSTTDSDFNIEKAAHRIYGGQDKNNTDQRIVISTWQSIYKLPTSWFNEFGCVIGDEAHNFKAKSLTSVLTKCHNAAYRFGTTGTLDGTQTHKLVLEGLFGPVHHVTSTKELMDEGSLASLDINVLQITDQHDNHTYTFITLENTKYRIPNDTYVILNDGTSKKAVDITTDDDISESFISSILKKYKYQ